MTSPEARSIVAQLKRLLGRCPRSWLDQPAVHFELGRTYALLGEEYFTDAYRFYRAAVAAEDESGRLPVAAIEQLANIESRLGEHHNAPDQVDRAIQRLQDLDQIVDGNGHALSEASETKRAKANVERQSLIGSAYKRKAAIYARRILSSEKKPSQESTRGIAAALSKAVAAYERASAASQEDRLDPDPYPMLNGLALRTIEGDYPDGVAECIACAERANERFGESPDVWHAVMAAEAHLVEALCSGAWSGDDAAAEKAFEQVQGCYASALANMQLAPKDLDSIARQLCLLALFFDAKGATRTQAARARADGMTAQRLRRLADKILPGSCKAPRDGPAAAGAKAKPQSKPKRRRR